MGLSDLFKVLIQWLHAVAAVAWVGGSIFYWWVLRPAFSAAEVSPALSRWRGVIAAGFKDLVDTAILVLIVTGGVMAFDRLSEGKVTTAYVVLLGIKIALAGGMFVLARRMGRSEGSPTAIEDAGSAASEVRLNTSAPRRGFIKHLFAPTNGVLILGLGVFLLASILRAIYEASLKAG